MKRPKRQYVCVKCGAPTTKSDNNRGGLGSWHCPAKHEPTKVRVVMRGEKRDGTEQNSDGSEEKNHG